MATRQDASTGKIITVTGAETDTDGTSRPSMHIKIYSPYQTYIDQVGYSISALNDTGPFDILPKHHNFMTLLKPYVLKVDTSTGLQRIRIDRGVMHVKADRVTVFLDV